MKYKIGESLIQCWIDSDTGRTVWSTYRIRSIRGGKVFAIDINEFTWVKLRWGKDQTFGWAEKIDPCFRKSCREGERFADLHRTKRQALRYAQSSHAAMMERRRLRGDC